MNARRVLIALFSVAAIFGYLPDSHAKGSTRVVKKAKKTRTPKLKYEVVENPGTWGAITGTCRFSHRVVQKTIEVG